MARAWKRSAENNKSQEDCKFRAFWPGRQVCRLLLLVHNNFVQVEICAAGKRSSNNQGLSRWGIPCLGGRRGASLGPADPPLSAVPSHRNAKWSPDGACGGAVRADFRRNCRMGPRGGPFLGWIPIWGRHIVVSVS